MLEQKSFLLLLFLLEHVLVLLVKALVFANKHVHGRFLHRVHWQAVLRAHLGFDRFCIVHLDVLLPEWRQPENFEITLLSVDFLGTPSVVKCDGLNGPYLELAAEGALRLKSVGLYQRGAATILNQAAGLGCLDEVLPGDDASMHDICVAILLVVTLRVRPVDKLTVT